MDADPTLTDFLRIDPFFKDKIGVKRALSDGKASSCGSNFTRASLTAGRDTSSLVIEEARKMAENLDYVQGFQFHFALHGATGAGIATMA